LRKSTPLKAEEIQKKSRRNPEEIHSRQKKSKRNSEEIHSTITEEIQKKITTLKAEEIPKKSGRNPLHYERRNSKEIHFTLTEEKGFMTLFWVIPHLLFRKHVLSHIFAFPLKIILNDENASFSLVIRTYIFVIFSSSFIYVISIAMAMIMNLI